MATETNTNDTTDIGAQMDEYNQQNELMQRKIDDAKVEGWRVKSEQGDRTIMTKPNYGSFGGHVLIALLTIWWTLGLGNVCYAAYKYWSDSDKKVLRV